MIIAIQGQIGEGGGESAIISTLKFLIKKVALEIPISYSQNFATNQNALSSRVVQQDDWNLEGPRLHRIRIMVKILFIKSQ